MTDDDNNYYFHAYWRYFLRKTSEGREFLHKWRQKNDAIIEDFKSDFLPTKEGKAMAHGKLKELKWQESYVKRLLDDMWKAKANSPDNQDFFWDYCIKDAEKELKKVRGDIWKFRNWYLSKKLYFPSGRRQFDIDKLKRVPISFIIGREPARRNPESDVYFCPLHKENNPSFTVWNSENRWYCFSENIGGDVIDLYMKLFNCDFIEACESLSLK